MSSDIITKLSAATGMPESLARRVVTSAPIRYKSYAIPKRDGTLRIIAQPAREVKLLQRALASLLLSDLPIHGASTAYRSGQSILQNATPHAGNGPILKMDFKDFFTSIRADDWISYCDEREILSEEDRYLTALLLFRRTPKYVGLRLAIGAPTSPLLSNILMYKFDHMLQSKLERKVKYTRYADDLTFSAPRTGYMVRVRETVAHVLRNISHPRLELNHEKTTYATTKYRRVVTGLTLANDGRVTIGRENKRRVHAAVHRVALGQLPLLEMAKLAGTLAYINSVEPGFVRNLEFKYGSTVIERIKRFSGSRPG